MLKYFSFSELRALLALVGPILVTQVAQTANGFIDTVMAGAVGPNDLAAVAVGSGIWIPAYLFTAGILIANNPVIAQHLGAGEIKKIPVAVHQGIWIAVVLGILGFIFMRNVSPIIEMMNVDASIRPQIQAYCNGMSYSMPAAAFFLAIRSFCDALSKPHPVMIISVIGTILNIPFNYILIHGKFGLPAMGGVGCGYATSLVFWFMLISLALYVNAASIFKFAHPFRSFSAPDFPHIRKLIQLGLPIALAIFFEVSVFTLVSLFIGSLGARIVASHQITLNIASLSFMVPLSIAMASTIRVGEGIGAGQVNVVAQRCVTSLCLSLFIACFAATGMAFFAEQLTGIYTKEADIKKLAAELLTLAAIFQISDAMQANANGCLRGFKDTKMPMYLTLLAYWFIGMPSGYVLGMTSILTSPLGAHGFWIGLIIGLTCAASFLLIRLRSTYLRWSKSPLPMQ